MELPKNTRLGASEYVRTLPTNSCWLQHFHVVDNSWGHPQRQCYHCTLQVFGNEECFWTTKVHHLRTECYLIHEEYWVIWQFVKLKQGLRYNVCCLSNHPHTPGSLILEETKKKVVKFNTFKRALLEWSQRWIRTSTLVTVTPLLLAVLAVLSEATWNSDDDVIKKLELTVSTRHRCECSTKEVEEWEVAMVSIEIAHHYIIEREKKSCRTMA